MRAHQRFVTIVALCGFTSWAWAQCGEQPTDSPCAPRIMPGTPGVHEVLMDVSSAAGGYVPACGTNVGKTV